MRTNWFTDWFWCYLQIRVQALGGAFASCFFGLTVLRWRHLVFRLGFGIVCCSVQVEDAGF